MLILILAKSIYFIDEKEKYLDLNEEKNVKSIDIIKNSDKHFNELFSSNSIKKENFTCDNIHKFDSFSQTLLASILALKLKTKVATDYLDLSGNHQALVTKGKNLQKYYFSEFTRLNKCLFLLYMQREHDNLDSKMIAHKKHYKGLINIVENQYSDYKKAQIIFQAIFDQFSVKSFLDLIDQKLLRHTYSVYSSFYERFNNNQYSSKIKVLIDNPHNASFMKWLRESKFKNFPQDTLLVHVDSHTDLTSILYRSDDPIFRNFTIVEINSILDLLVSQEARKKYLLIKLIESFKDHKFSEKYKIKLFNWIQGHSIVEIREKIFQVFEEGFKGNYIVSSITELLKSEDNINEKRKKIQLLINDSQIDAHIKESINQWIKSADSDNLTQHILSVIQFFSGHIAMPLVSALSTNVTNKILMLKPPWVVRVPHSFESEFDEFELITTREDYDFDKKSRVMPALVMKNQQTVDKYSNHSSPFVFIYEDSIRKTIKKFSYLSVNLSNEVFAGDTIGGIDGLDKLIKKDGFILGIDLDTFSTNSANGGTPIEPLSFGRPLKDPKNEIIKKRELDLVFDRITVFKYSLKRLKMKPSLITFSDSTNQLRSNPSDDFGSLMGGNFTPIGLIFLINFKLRTVMNELYNTPIW